MCNLVSKESEASAWRTGGRKMSKRHVPHTDKQGQSGLQRKTQQRASETERSLQSVHVCSFEKNRCEVSTTLRSMRPRPRPALFMVLNLKIFALTMIIHTVWRLGSGCICGCLFLKISFTWKWSHSRCRLVSAHVSKMGRDWFLFF